MIAQLVASQAEHGAFSTIYFEAIRVSQFMRLNPPTFTGAKVNEDLQGFLDEMKKIFKVMHVTNVEGVEFAAY